MGKIDLEKMKRKFESSHTEMVNKMSEKAMRSMDHGIRGRSPIRKIVTTRGQGLDVETNVVITPKKNYAKYNVKRGMKGNKMANKVSKDIENDLTGIEQSFMDQWQFEWLVK